MSRLQIEYVVLALSTAGFGWLIWHYPFFYDDAFISMRISRNFAEGHGLFHNLEEKVQTNTSLLFPILAAPIHFFSRTTAISLTLLFDLAVSLINICLLLRLNHRLCPGLNLSPGARAILALYVSVIFFTSAIVVPGMETQVFLCLILLFIDRVAAQKPALAPGLSASFIRPEGALVALIWQLFNLRQQGNNFTLPTRFLIWTGLAGFLYLLIQWMLYGQLIPHTIAVKWLIKSNWADSLSHFFFSVLFPARYPFRSVVTAIGLFALWDRRKEPIFQFLALYLLGLAFVYVGLSGGSSFFGWYFAPIKAIFLLLSATQLSGFLAQQKDIRRWALAGLLLLSYPAYTTCAEAMRYRQEGIFTAARQLNQLTQNRAYIITCEPIGILGYFNPNSSFRDYPGLASQISWQILKAEGPVYRAHYFENPVFEKIISEGGAHLVLLSPPEYESYKALMNRDFEPIVKIGKDISSEYNSDFYVFANPKTLSESKIQELKKQASLLH